MAWVKIPKENHPLFHAALPRDPRVSTVNMFGGVGAKVNGQMFAGLFARSAIVKLSPDDQRAALDLDGAALFDPMGNGRVMHDTVQLPEALMDEPDELQAWFRKALDYIATLPAKGTAKGVKPTAKAKAKPAAKAKAKPAAKAKPKPAAKAKPKAKPRRRSI
jgi:TfoX/Sxy family transcriptional regulator of competence genes